MKSHYLPFRSWGMTEGRYRTKRGCRNKHQGGHPDVKNHCFSATKMKHMANAGTMNCLHSWRSPYPYLSTTYFLRPFFEKPTSLLWCVLLSLEPLLFFLTLRFKPVLKYL
ncbi:rCG46346, partial [Rattus norvegicus]